MSSVLIVLTPNTGFACSVLKFDWLKTVVEQKASKEQQETAKNLICNFAEIGKINAIKRVAAQIAAFTISKEAVADLRSTFMQLDKDSSGVICLEEFKAAMQNTGMDEEEVVRLYKDMDIDDTGAIEYSEFISAALLVTKSRSRHRIATPPPCTEPENPALLACQRPYEKRESQVPLHPRVSV